MIVDINLAESLPGLRFDVSEPFAGDSVDCRDVTLFPNGIPEGLRQSHANIALRGNVYIDNEIRSFLEYLVKEKHIKAPQFFSTAAIARLFSEFMAQQCGYDDYASVLDYENDLEYLEHRWLEWLQNKGYATTHSMNRRTADGSDVKYETKNNRALFAGQVFYYVFCKSYDVRKVVDGLPVLFRLDRVDLRLSGLNYSHTPATPRHVINFSCIKNPWIKDLAKKVIYKVLYAFSGKRVQTLESMIKSVSILAEYVNCEDKDLKSLKDIDRKRARAIFVYFSGKKNKESLYSQLKSFFDFGYLLVPDKFPDVDYLKDFKFITKKPDDYKEGYSIDEINSINRYIDELEPQLVRATYILETLGSRGCEVMGALVEPDGHKCIEKVEGRWFFRYISTKKKRFREIIVEDTLARIIIAAVRESVDKFGADVKYIFAQSQSECIRRTMLADKLSDLVVRHNLKRDNGEPFTRVCLHDFRRAIATRLINNFASPDVIEKVLGHRGHKSLKHYARIHSELMIEACKPYLERVEYMIKNIGNEKGLRDLAVNTNTMMPVFGGFCSAKQMGRDCGNPYACIKCVMFEPAKEYLTYYKDLLRAKRTELKVLKVGGDVKSVDVNKAMDVILSLESMVRILEDE